MKLVLAFLLLMAVTPIHGQLKKRPDKHVTYHIKDIDRSSLKFDKIYAKVLAKESSSGWRTVSVRSHVEGELYLAETIHPPGAFAREFGSLTRTYTPPPPTETIAIHVLPGTALVDGDQIKIQLARLDKTYQYITVLGAKKTVRIYQQRSFSKEIFVAQLKQGKTFTIHMTKGAQPFIVDISWE